MACSRELFVEKEYSQAQALERVGWTSVGPLHDDCVAVHIGTATVGENGAKLSYEKLENDRVLLSSDDAQGFHHVKGLYLLLERGSSNDKLLDVQELSNERTHHRTSLGSEYILSGGWTPGTELNNKVWANNSSELLQAIKRGLDRVDARTLYPYVYYYLNGHVAHPSRTPETDSDIRQRLFFPDSEMSITTKKQLDISAQTLDALEAVYR